MLMIIILYKNTATTIFCQNNGKIQLMLDYNFNDINYLFLSMSNYRVGFFDCVSRKPSRSMTVENLDMAAEVYDNFLMWSADSLLCVLPS